MKTTLFLGLFLFFKPIIFMAQSPVINETSVLAVGPIDDFTLLFGQLILGAESFATADLAEGEDQDWDLTELDSITLTTEISKFVFACADVALFEIFEDCERVNSQIVGSFIQFNQFLNFESPDLTELGFTNNSSGENQATICASRRIMYQFPLAFGNIFTSSFSCHPETLGAGFQEAEEGERICEVDGWGTIHLPNFTFDNVLRLKTVETGTMMSYFDGSLLQEIAFVRTLFEYLDGSHPYPVAAISKTELGQNPATYSAEYLIESDVNGLKKREDPLSGWGVYPNPILDHGFYLEYSNLTHPDLYYHLYGMDGKLIYQDQKQVSPGTGEVEIKIPPVAGGIYLLKVFSGDHSGFFKIQVPVAAIR